MTYPIPGVGVSTPYGKRGPYWSCNDNGSGGVHTGVDFAAPVGTNVYAPIAGQIRHRSYGSAFGGHQFAISPDPGEPFADGEVFFAHMVSRPTSGSYVEVGDYLGDVGAEGNVSGPHLHMEYHADTKGQWSCSTHDDPQPVLDHAGGSSGNPGNPNDVQVGDLVIVVAAGELNGRDTPGGDVITARSHGDEFKVGALVDGWAQEATAADLSASPLEGDPVPTPATGYLLGADVSSHQADWAGLADDEFYCWVKATEGRSYVNPEHDDQVAAIRADGKQVGHYHWLVPGNVDAQLDYFLQHAKLQPGDLVACDWEDSGNPSCAEKDQWIEAAIARLAGANKVGLYCNRDWWINRDVSSYYGDYLWIANYTTDDDPGIQADWLFWQYTSTPYDRNRGRFADLAALQAWAGSGGGGDTPTPPIDGGAWYSTDYLFPKVTPNPTNPNGVKKGDDVEVTASGGLTARTLPGGPPTLDSSGKPLTRPAGYRFDVTGELVDGWVTGGTNWYSSDYLDVVEAPTVPSWSSKPTVILDDPTPDPNRYVSYAQAVVRVAALDTADGQHYDACYLLAQDYKNNGDIRFYLARANGTYADQWMQVNDAGHGQTFHAYRSAAGNLYVWCGEDPAYRYKWQSGKTVSKSSGDKMDYKGCRPVGSYEPWVGFRDATDTRETFYLFDRTDFTDGTNRTKPVKSVTVDKRTNYTQQSWAVSDQRIYRLMGSTNDDPPHGSKLHILDVFDWSGRLLLDRFDVTAMAIESTSDEPEGLTFSGTPGSLLAGKREGSTDPGKRSYPIWTLAGLP